MRSCTSPIVSGRTSTRSDSTARSRTTPVASGDLARSGAIRADAAASILRRPFAPGSHERKIQAGPYRLGTQFSGQQRVALQLRPIALDLAIQKLRESSAAVLARLVVDDPTGAALIDEATVEHGSDPL